MISELVSIVKIDAGQAAREAKAHADRLRGLKTAQDAVTKADKEAAEAATKLRKELLDLKKVEVAGTGDKKALAKQAQEVRLRLQEQAEGARALRVEQKALRDEQRQLQASMRETARAAQQTARAEADALRMVARAEADLHRERMNHRRLQQSGARINELTDSVSAADARLMRLRQPFGGLRVRAGDAVSDFRDNWRDRIGSRIDAAGGAGRLAGLGRTALGAAAGIGGVAIGATAGIAARGGNFESLRASLETVEGSAQKAAASFRLIQEFAGKTPFTVEQTTQALTKLKAQGLDASLPALTAYGDTAAAMGKNLNDAVEAVADATTGEFERLKEFGIKTKSEGDKVTFTFRGVSTAVAKESKSIEKYLIGIGQTNFAGGMERQSKTLEGQLSTLGDAVSQLADQAFQGGLGQALKDVVADMTGAADAGGDLAKAVGQRLGDAVRSAYRTIKEFVGPVDELPAKFNKAVDVLGSFASTVGTVVSGIASLTSGFDATTVAITGMAAAAASALGPLGKAAALGSLIGFGVGKTAMDVSGSLEDRIRAAGGDPAAVERARVAEELARAQAQEAELAANNERQGGLFEGAKGAEARYKAARLRALGKTEDQLTAKERADIANKSSRLFRQARTGDDSRASTQGRGSVDDLISNAERAANEAEFGRLRQAQKRGPLSPSQKKRLTELGGVLDRDTTKGGKAKKPELTAFEQERKSEIDALVKRAELDAADRALASGNAAGADSAAREAGKATRARLTEQARSGALPGEVERALLREAGFEDAKAAPPPPVIVYQQTFNVPVNFEVGAVATIHGGTVGELANGIGSAVKTTLERDVIPPTRESFRSAIRR